MPINLVSGNELLPDSEGHPDGDGGDVVAGNAQHAEEDDQKLVETHSTETVRRPAKYFCHSSYPMQELHGQVHLPPLPPQADGGAGQREAQHQHTLLLQAERGQDCQVFTFQVEISADWIREEAELDNTQILSLTLFLQFK